MSNDLLRFDPLQFKTDRMFLGSCDDSVTRYPWEGLSVTLDSFNMSLIFYALLGPKLCCRIGNIIYNPNYFKAFTNIESSPLLHLARSGFFQFQMKQETINETIEERRRIGTNSTIEFIEKYNWQKGSAIYNYLNNIDSQLTNKVSKIKYSPQFHKYFQHIINEIQPERNSPFGKVFHSWIDKYTGLDRTRSNFEELAKKMFPGNTKLLIGAMSPINSINHYAYGLGLKEHFDNVSIETIEINKLQKYTTTYLGQEEREIDILRINELEKLKVFDVIEKYLNVPDKLLYDPKCWEIISNLASAKTVTKKQGEFVELKSNILDTINKFGHTNNISQTKNQLKEACKALSLFVSSELSQKSSEKVKIRFKLLLGKVIGKGTGVGLGDVVSKVADEVSPPFTKWIFRLIAQFGVDKASDFFNRNVDEFRSTKKDTDKLSIEKIRNAIICPSIRRIERNDI